ncbi:MAG: Pvc16 family protein [Dehalococcoidia bacterium]
MISDLNESIKELLTKRGLLDPAEVDIKFEMPNRSWSASVSKPTVNIYLYDVRENHQLRGTEWIVTRDENGKATRKKNPSRVDVAYLITVWTSDIADEHRLLWHVLRTLSRYPHLPGELLYGQLASQEYPIKTSTAQPDGLFNNPADFWSALDNEIKASINYVVTLPLDTDVEFTAPVVTTKVIDYRLPDADAERLVQVAGIVHKAGQPSQGIPEARVVAKEAGMTTLTDAQGRYSFAKISPGKHTFQVLIAGKKAHEASIIVPSTSYDLEV